MDKKLDLSIEVAGVKFRNPVLAASSECTSNQDLISRLALTSVGGLVTKTYTSRPDHKSRVRPYQFPLNVYGKAYRDGNCMYSLAAPHVEGWDLWVEKIHAMAEICRCSSLPLIVSYFEDPGDLSLWATRAKGFEEAGAVMLELNFSCPHTSKVFQGGMEALASIVSRVRKEVSIPVGVKIGPNLEPLEALVIAIEQVSPDFMTAHNAPSGILVDVEEEVPFGAPSIGGYAMGRTFLPYSLARVVRILKSSKIPIIGIGGIDNASDALQYLLCGTSLVGIGSALYFRGFEILNRIPRDISEWMDRKGYRKINDFKGKVLPFIEEPSSLALREQFPFTVPPHCPYSPSVDKELCTGCGTCVRSCIYEALILNPGESVPSVLEQKCWSCGFCVGICPSGAIMLRERKPGGRVMWKNRGMANSFIRNALRESVPVAGTVTDAGQR